MAQLPLDHGLAILQGRMRAVRALLWIYIATIVALIVSWGPIAILRLDQSGQEFQPLVILGGIAAIAFLAAFLATIIAVCLWTYRAHANLFAAGLEGLEFTPGWSVGWFFVPVAFWFRPFAAMRELWNASHLHENGYAAPAEPLLKIWWGFWVVGNIILNISTRLSASDDGIGIFDLIGFTLSSVAAWFLLRIVKSVTEAQSSDLRAAHAFA